MYAPRRFESIANDRHRADLERPVAIRTQATFPRRLLAPFEPILQVLMRKRAVALVRLGERTRIHVRDPAFVRTGTILRQNEPEQAAASLPWHFIPLEQHSTQQGLGPVVALLGGKAQPACRLDGVLTGPLSGEIEPAEIVLRFRVGVIRGGVPEHLTGEMLIGPQQAGNAVEVVLAERDKSVGYESRMRGIRAVIAVHHRKAPKIIVGATLVRRHALAVGIHAAELPDRAGHTLLGRIFELGDALVGSALAQRLRPGAERLIRRRHRGSRRNGPRRKRDGGKRRRPAETAGPGNKLTAGIRQRYRDARAF